MIVKLLYDSLTNDIDEWKEEYAARGKYLVNKTTKTAFVVGDFGINYNHVILLDKNNRFIFSKSVALKWHERLIIKAAFAKRVKKLKKREQEKEEDIRKELQAGLLKALELWDEKK